MTPREHQIKQCQKFYLKIRAMHDDCIYLQILKDELKLYTPESTIPLYVINLELEKYHDEARSMERDLDEKQQNHFTKRTFNVIRRYLK